MKFNEHGSFTISCENRLLLARAVGAFNQEGAHHYCEAMREQATKLNGKPFVVLVDLIELEGATPEAWDLLESHNQWLDSTSMVAKAIVAGGAVVKTYASTANLAILQEKLQLFEDIEAAKDWLRAQLGSE